MSVSSDPLPPLVKLTYDDYVLFPDDGKRHEIINGRHYMNASPVPRHQYVSGELFAELRALLKPHQHSVFAAPIDVQLSESDVVVPDIVVVSNDNDIITDTRIIGPPDLIIEILSPSTRANDENLKRRLYEQAGVPEYWLVDPDANHVSVLRMVEGQYQQAAPVADAVDTTVGSSRVTVDLTRVW